MPLPLLLGHEADSIRVRVEAGCNMNEEDVEAASEKLRLKRLLSRQRKEQGLRKKYKRQYKKLRDKRTTSAITVAVAASLPDEVISGSGSGGVSRRTSIGGGGGCCGG